MKINKSFLVALLLLLTIQFVTAQNTTEEQTTPEYATVYIVRTSGLGALINFKYFVDDKYVGKCNYGKYLKLTLSAGEYVIWARAENSSFVEAQLENGKTYIIEAVPKMGALKASVKLEVITELDEKTQKKLDKNFEKRELIQFSETELNEGQIEYSDQIIHGIEKYNELKLKGNEIPKLNVPIVLNTI
jgi:hypothetical protein